MGYRIKDFEKIEDHDHLCFIYRTEKERLAATLAYVQIGLQRGAHCFCIDDDRTLATLRSALHEDGIDVDAAKKSGQLILINEGESYLKRGPFDPDLPHRFGS